MFGKDRYTHLYNLHIQNPVAGVCIPLHECFRERPRVPDGTLCSICQWKPANWDSCRPPGMNFTRPERLEQCKKFQQV
jgi:hypothetical protein